MGQNDVQGAPIVPSGMANKGYRDERRKKKKPFNCELEHERREHLRQVADARGISMGACVRQLISTAHEMEVMKHPKCVNGHVCYMPHMHPTGGD